MHWLMPDDFEELHLVAWRVEEGHNDPANPLLTPEMPWDAGGVMAHGTVLKDPIDGRWKAWQISTPETQVSQDLGHHNENERRLTYLESADGVQWVRPQLDLCPWEGHPRTNILLDHGSGGTCTYASVMVHPEQEENPYEMFLYRQPGYKNPSGTVGGIPAPNGKRALYRYRSRDGLRWEVVAGPLMITPSDVCFVFPRKRGGYAAYYKVTPPLKAHQRQIPYDNGVGVVRALTRKVTDDGAQWSSDGMLLESDWRDPADTQMMEMNVLEAEDRYVATVGVYHAVLQTLDLQLAVSRDGIAWWMPDRRPALPNPPLGDWGGGMIWQLKNLIVEDGRLFVYYSGVEGQHGEMYDTRHSPRLEARGESVIYKSTPTLPFHGALCRAGWDWRRLWALVPSAGGSIVGEAVAPAADVQGQRLSVNVLAKSPGEMRVELLDRSGEVVPGFSRQECSPIRGDQPQAFVRWDGGSAAPSGTAKARFCLYRTYLYGYDWQD